MARNSNRTIIIGLDGMPYRLIKDLASHDVMPNTKRIIEQGTFRQMESSIPEISSVAWSSVMTGVNPGRHGIFGFTDVPDGTYRLSFPNFNDLKASPFWNHEGNGRSVIVNLPFTYPAPSLNGVLIAGFVALDLKRATHPPSLIPKLNEMDYRIDVDSSTAHKSMDLFLKNLDRTLNARIAAYRYLWDKEDWQTFMLVFTGTDRLGHFLWDAYEDSSHKHHSAFLDHLHKIDEVVGEIAGRIAEDDLLIMLSDHGFESSGAEVQMNFILSQEGFLKVLLSNPGFDLKASLKARRFSQKGIFTGKHTQEDAFLLINSASEDIIPPELSVADVVGVMKSPHRRRGSKGDFQILSPLGGES